jgi:hypothetical protein
MGAVGPNGELLASVMDCYEHLPMSKTAMGTTEHFGSAWRADRRGARARLATRDAVHADYERLV